MGDIALRGNKLTKGPHGFGPKPYLNKPGQAQGTHGGKAKGGRIGFRHGKGPHGFGPKPYLHKPGVGPHGQPGGRKGKAIGGILKAGKQAVKKIISKIKKGKGSEKGKKGLGSGIKPSEMRETIPTKEGRREYLKQWSPHYGGRSLKQEMKGKPHAEGGRIGLKHGGWKKPSWMGKPSKMGKFDRKVPWRDKKTHGKDVPTMAAKGGRIGLKKGTDKKSK